MSTWPFTHDWSSSYQVTVSFKTEILVARSGLEQRRALRGEPRRALQTRVLADARIARQLDRFLWNEDSFNYPEPVGAASPLVRLVDSTQIEHRTSGVSVSDIGLAVSPGTETFATPTVDASFSYQLRLAFPFKVNWTASVTDSVIDNRETVDFDYGRIRVAHPIAFRTRTAQLQTLVEDNRLSDFFRLQRGRQGDFWMVSTLDDLETVSLIGTQLTVIGDMRPLDGIDWGVFVETVAGGRYFRQVVNYGLLVDNTTFLQLDQGVPDTSSVRKCSWVRLARFASDDLTIEWITSTVARSQVQLQTVPFAAAEDPLALDTGSQYFVDYYGWSNWLDPLDYIVNIQMPRL